MSEHGNKANAMEKELRLIVMEINIMENIKMVKHMVKVH